MSSVLELEQRRITLAEYHRMVEAGVFDEDERLELLEGVIVKMSPQSPEHAHVIRTLNKALVLLLRDTDLQVGPQLPLTLPPDSEPEPDLAVVEPDRSGGHEHPKTARLVIEVARDSIRKDRLVKSALYARALVPEYWIVNVRDRSVEVHRDPDAVAGRYRSVLTFVGSQDLASSAVPEVRLSVTEIFG